jgi:hypothetical protein
MLFLHTKGYDMYILTTFYGKKICAGSFDKCQYQAQWGRHQKYRKLWAINSGGIRLVTQYNF